MGAYIWDLFKFGCADEGHEKSSTGSDLCFTCRANFISKLSKCNEKLSNKDIASSFKKIVHRGMVKILINLIHVVGIFS